MTDLFIPVIQGTDRPDNKSINVAKLVADLGGKQEGVNTQLINPLNFDFSYASKDPKYTDVVTRADAFVIVSPEYNHAIPGTLKSLLDTELKLYIHKPVALVGVSSGPWGGIRAVEALVTIVRELGMTATFTDVNVPSVKKVFDAEGTLLDEAYIERINNLYEELIWMAKVMKWGKENVPSKYHIT